MADWTELATTDNYATLLKTINDRDIDVAKMFEGTGTNLPVGVYRWNNTAAQFEKYNGSSWDIATKFALRDNTTEGFVWAKHNTSPALRATTYDTSINRNIIEARSGAGDGSLVWSAYAKADGSSLSYVYDITDSNRRMYTEIGPTIAILNAYDYGTSTPIDFQIGYSSAQTITIPAVLNASGGIIARGSGRIIEMVSPPDTANYIYGTARDGTSDGWYVGRGSDTSNSLVMTNYTTGKYLVLHEGGQLYYNDGVGNRQIWHEGNDGSGSGLDADTVDGLHASDFARANANTTIGHASGPTAMYINADPSNNRWILAPRLADDTGWDWGSEYYFDASSRQWGWDKTPFVSPDNGVTRYDVWHGANNIVSKATNGYQKLQNGLIIQWGRVNAGVVSGGAYAIGSQKSVAITFPIAFPTACLNVSATAFPSNDGIVANTGRGSATRKGSSTTGATIAVEPHMDNYNANFYIDWIAIGY